MGMESTRVPSQSKMRASTPLKSSMLSIFIAGRPFLATVVDSGERRRTTAADGKDGNEGWKARNEAWYKEEGEEEAEEGERRREEEGGRRRELTARIRCSGFFIPP